MVLKDEATQRSTPTTIYDYFGFRFDESVMGWVLFSNLYYTFQQIYVRSDLQARYINSFRVSHLWERRVNQAPDTLSYIVFNIKKSEGVVQN